MRAEVARPQAQPDARPAQAPAADQESSAPAPIADGPRGGVDAWNLTGSPSRPSKRRHHRVQPTWMRPLRPGRSRLSRKIPRIPIRMMRLRASPPQHHSPVLPRKIQRLKIPRLAPAHHRRRKRTCLPKPSLYPLKYPKIVGICGFPRAVWRARFLRGLGQRDSAAGFSELARTG